MQRSAMQCNSTWPIPGRLGAVVGRYRSRGLAAARGCMYRRISPGNVQSRAVSPPPPPRPSSAFGPVFRMNAKPLLLLLMGPFVGCGWSGLVSTLVSLFLYFFPPLARVLCDSYVPILWLFWCSRLLLPNPFRRTPLTAPIRLSRLLSRSLSFSLSLCVLIPTDLNCPPPRPGQRERAAQPRSPRQRPRRRAPSPSHFLCLVPISLAC